MTRRFIISRHGARILAENAVRDGQAETERDHLLLVMARCPFCEGSRVQVTTVSALVEDLTNHILEAHRVGGVTP